MFRSNLQGITARGQKFPRLFHGFHGSKSANRGSRLPSHSGGSRVASTVSTVHFSIMSKRKTIGCGRAKKLWGKSQVVYKPNRGTVEPWKRFFSSWSANSSLPQSHRRIDHAVLCTAHLRTTAPNLRRRPIHAPLGRISQSRQKQSGICDLGSGWRAGGMPGRIADCPKRFAK
jgi:hypothetical protein